MARFSHIDGETAKEGMRSHRKLAPEGWWQDEQRQLEAAVAAARSQQDPEAVEAVDASGDREGGEQ